MGFWDNKNINDASSTKGGLYFEPGNYLVQVQCCKMIVTRNKDNMFVAECIIIKSDSDNKSLQPGAEPAYAVNMDGRFPDLSMGNVADFMRAGLASMAEQVGEEHEEVDKIEIDDDTANSITDEEENLLSGVFLEVKAWNKPTREGNDFTRVNFRVPGNVQGLAEEHAA